VYHVLNRANGRRRIFERDRDYLVFERTLAEVQARVPMRILAWCLMPNHWHLVLWPRQDADLSNYMRLVTLIHTQRWHAHRASAGTGHLYQGRFKSFVVQGDAHFLAVSAQVMRRILVDHARSRQAQKRGGGAARVTFDEALLVVREPGLDFVALDDALKALAAFDQRKSRVIELRFFGGLSVEETASALNVSPDTVMRDWRLARAWLQREMRGDGSHDA